MPQAKAIPVALANCPSTRACPGRLDRLEEPEPSHKPQQFTRDERLVRGVPMHTLLSARRARDDLVREGEIGRHPVIGRVSSNSSVCTGTYPSRRSNDRARQLSTSTTTSRAHACVAIA